MGEGEGEGGGGGRRISGKKPEWRTCATVY